LHVIITAANTVSRASEAVSEPPETISVTIRATSMTVTATARTSDPNGSPTRCATTSAWCTAASTEPARNKPTTTTTAGAGLVPHVSASGIGASRGMTRVQRAVMP
jgi:hypothetical protein